MKKTSNQTREMVFMAVLVAQAIVLSIVERWISGPFIMVPGAKLGLANVITVTALYVLTLKQAWVVVVMRVILVAVLLGSLSTLLYSGGGAVLSFVVMAFLIKQKAVELHPITISIVGAVMHNIGQVMVAAMILETWLIMSYLPWLLFLAIPTGFFVGVSSSYLKKHLAKIL